MMFNHCTKLLSSTIAPCAPGIIGLEGKTHGHDVISVKLAIEYLESHNQKVAADHLKGITAPKNTYTFLGSSDKWDANRNVFGDAAVAILGRMSAAERLEKVKVKMQSNASNKKASISV